MKPRELAEVTSRTLAHYEVNAAAFRAGTWEHDVAQNRTALLEALMAKDGPAPGAARFSLLDFGCGPGRDLVAFRALGHEVVGLDGAASFVAMAREVSGAEVLHQNFVALDLPPARFDGVFANASLFHVPREVLRRVLCELHATLRPRGALLVSNPRGEDQEGFRGDRYGAFHSLEAWRTYVEAAGFALIDHYYRPEGKPRHEQPWLVTVWRRLDGLPA